jgi:hypothetical protein
MCHLSVVLTHEDSITLIFFWRHHRCLTWRWKIMSSAFVVYSKFIEKREKFLGKTGKEETEFYLGYCICCFSW